MTYFSFADVTAGQSLATGVGTLAEALPGVVEAAHRGTLAGIGNTIVQVELFRPLEMESKRVHLMVCPSVRRHLNTWKGRTYKNSSRSDTRVVSHLVRTACTSCLTRADTSIDLQRLLLVGWTSKLVTECNAVDSLLSVAGTGGQTHTWANSVEGRLQTAQQALAGARAAAQALHTLGADDPDAAAVTAAGETSLARMRTELGAATDTASAHHRKLACQTGTFIWAAMIVAETSIRAATLAADGRGYLLAGEDINWGVTLGGHIRMGAEKLARGIFEPQADTAADMVCTVVDAALADAVNDLDRYGPQLFTQLPQQFDVTDAAAAAAPRRWLAEQWAQQARELLGTLAEDFRGMLIRALNCPAPLYRLRLAGEIPNEIKHLVNVFDTSCVDVKGVYTGLVPAVVAQAVLVLACLHRRADISAAVADPSFDGLTTLVNAMPEDNNAVALLWSDRYVVAADTAGADLAALSGEAFPAWADWPSMAATG